MILDIKRGFLELPGPTGYRTPGAPGIPFWFYLARSKRLPENFSLKNAAKLF
jgi:hypothetical protein